MKRFPRLDANQKDIVAALRACGASVQSLAAIGGGCPDLLVSYRDRTRVLECKNGDKPPSAQKLTDDQVEWHRTWNDDVLIVRSPIEAVEALRAFF